MVRDEALQLKDETAVGRYAQAVESLSRAHPPDRRELLGLLILRECVADDVAGALPSAEKIEAISKADRMLVDAASWLATGSRLTVLEDWRQAVVPRATSWWWHLDEVPGDAGLSAASIAIAGALLATSLALMTDVMVRLLSGGADLLGLAGTMAQSFIVLLAGGVLTPSGRQWLSGILRWRRVARKSQALWTITWSAVVLLLASLSWLSLKPISRYYSDQGARRQIHGKLSKAIDSYTRALRANPNNGPAHYNLATAQELFRDHEGAIVHYRAALAQDGQMYPAYANLARLHILTGNPAAAVELLGKCIDRQRQSDKAVTYSCHKNLAWAYLELGFFRLGEKEVGAALELRDGAAAHCIRAQIIERQSPSGHAEDEWQLCLAGAAEETSAIEPVWLGMAKERLLVGGAQ